MNERDTTQIISLEPSQLDDLQRDLEACTEMLEIRVKSASPTMSSDGPNTTTQAFGALLAGSAQAIQLRYRYEDIEWFDTLMHTPEGIRLVRTVVPKSA